MITLGELRPGDMFRTGDGSPWVYLGGDKVECVWVGTGQRWFSTPDRRVEPLDLPALLKEHHELLGLVHDLLIDSAAYERGREAERGEVVRLLGEGTTRERHRARQQIEKGDHAAAATHYARADAILAHTHAVRARGPAAAPDPPARLAARVRELEGALRGLVGAAASVGGDESVLRRMHPEHGVDLRVPAGKLLAIGTARAAAHAALEGAGEKQPT